MTRPDLTNGMIEIEEGVEGQDSDRDPGFDFSQREATGKVGALAPETSDNPPVPDPDQLEAATELNDAVQNPVVKFSYLFESWLELHLAQLERDLSPEDWERLHEPLALPSHTFSFDRIYIAFLDMADLDYLLRTASRANVEFTLNELLNQTPPTLEQLKVVVVELLGMDDSAILENYRDLIKEFIRLCHELNQRI